VTSPSRVLPTLDRGRRALGMWVGIALLASLCWALTPAQPAHAATSDDWSTYLHDPGRSAASSDTTLGPANAAGMGRLWSFSTGGVVAASATVVAGTVYVGSWDGYEYAIDAGTGVQKWRTFLGITTGNAVCFPQTAGITSAATVQGGAVYVGGGDAYWYALDAATGSVMWKVFTGDNSATGGHYNWASPLLSSGFAYIGVSSFGDCPLVQGRLLQVSLSTHQVVNTFNVVPNGQVGGGIWTSPGMDTASNTVYITTGSVGDPSQTLSGAMVALDATTLALKGSWPVPRPAPGFDGDWGTSPIVFNDAGGRQLVAATNKDGITYAFDRNNVSGGPVWQRQIAVGGECPTCGEGSVSSMAFANGLLYAAGGNTTINGVAAAGSVRALNPSTGAIVWEHADAAPVIPALGYANGLVFAGAGPTFEVLNAASGAQLWSYATGADIYGAPSIANGAVYAGATDQKVYAFGLAVCPAGWTCGDIGNPTPAGGQTVSNGTWVLSGGGTDIWDTSDQFHYVWQSVPADAMLSARVQTQTFTDQWAKAGVMLRQSADPASAYYAFEVTPSNGLVVQYRATTGASALMAANPWAGVPAYLAVGRSGNTFTAYSSNDGQAWVAVDGSTVTLPTSGPMLAGLAVTSHDPTQLSVVTADSVTLNQPASPLTMATAATPTAGVAFPFTVTAKDPFGKPDPNYAGMLHFSSTDPTAGVVLPPDSRLTNGQGTFSATLIKAGSQRITASDGVRSATLTVTVNAAPASHLTLATTAAPTAMAGTSFSFKVIAQDPFSNTDPSYAGTVHFTSSDSSPGVVLPANATLVSGQRTFSATLDRAGSQTITATDTAKPSIAGNVAVAISPAGAAILGLTTPASTTANQPFNVTVSLMDRFGNVAAGYTGTVHFRTSDMLAQTLGKLPADYAFTAADAGTHTFAVSLMTPPSQTITVTDAANASLSATSAPITVNG
jgi:outer membrane protein assembly factor BamB